MLLRSVMALVGICMCTVAQTPDAELKAFLDESRAATLRQQGIDAVYQSAVDSKFAKRYREAEDAFRSVYRQEPQGTRAIEGIALVYLGEKRNEEAIRLMEAAVVSHPARLDVLLAFV